MDGWHQLDAVAVASRLAVDPSRGLAAAEAARRFDEHGPNELIDRGGRSKAAILLSQLTGTMVLLLIAAAVVSAAIGDFNDAAAIGAIVVLNAILGFTQEFRAERAMSALKQMATPVVRVRRDGQVRDVPARELVPGDVMLLEAGNVVAADARLVESVNLRAQEAALTGESESVDKTSGPIAAERPAVGDRRNMLFMGTSVVYGRGSAVVTATGMQTELGSIAATLQGVQPEATPLQQRLDALGRALAIAALAIVGVIFVLGLLRGETLRLMFLTAVSMAVAAVPEGLPAVVTIALAIGAQRMLRRRALIRKLSAVETLGSVTVICSDKTGTLTENRMRVTALETSGRSLSKEQESLPDLRAWSVAAAGPPRDAKPDDASQLELAMLLTGAALCNDAVLRPALAAGSTSATPADGREAIGDPTEAALVQAAADAGLIKDDLEARWPRVAEWPFDSERKRMTTVHAVPATAFLLEQAWLRAWSTAGNPERPAHVAFTKGAVDRLLEICASVWTDGALVTLDDRERERILAAHDRLAGQGIRVLGVAFRPWGSAPAPERAEEQLIFAGMAGLVDPPRAEARSAVATCVAAGIRPVMITGDHPLTARYVADKLGIPSADRPLTGVEIDGMSAARLEAAVARTSVFARVSPQHKFAIVEALQRKVEIVAMTGDGVNDAPALKRANIGVAMGITGTDVSKEAADAVLLDDNFATIVSAVEEGRIIYDNVRKFVKYLLTTNSAELWLMLIAPLIGMPLPLLPLQILWINLVTDGPTALTLGVEPAERGVMERPPRPPGESIFAGGLGRHVIWVGVFMGALTLGLGYWYWRAGDPRWQTVIFTTLALSQMAHVMGIRSSVDSLVRVGILSNPLLAGAVALTIVLQLALIYVEPLQQVFTTVPLSIVDLALCAAAAGAILVAVEMEKWLMRDRRSSVAAR